MLDCKEELALMILHLREKNGMHSTVHGQGCRQGGGSLGSLSPPPPPQIFEIITIANKLRLWLFFFFFFFFWKLHISYDVHCSGLVNTIVFNYDSSG